MTSELFSHPIKSEPTPPTAEEALKPVDLPVFSAGDTPQPRPRG